MTLNQLKTLKVGDTLRLAKPMSCLRGNFPAGHVIKVSQPRTYWQSHWSNNQPMARLCVTVSGMDDFEYWLFPEEVEKVE